MTAKWNRRAVANSTPGPWVVWAEHAEVHAGPAKRNTPAVIEGVRGHIASFTSDDWGGDDEASGEEIAQANARLGAAAPMLADALEAIIGEKNWAPVDQHTDMLIADARAALRAAGRLP